MRAAAFHVKRTAALALALLGSCVSKSDCSCNFGDACAAMGGSVRPIAGVQHCVSDDERVIATWSADGGGL